MVLTLHMELKCGAASKRRLILTNGALFAAGVAQHASVQWHLDYIQLD